MANRRAAGTAAALAAGLTGMTVALGGCDSLSAATYHEDRRYQLPGTVLGLSLRVDVADVEIVGSDTTTINVHERLSWSRERKPTATHHREGDTLMLGYTCPRGVVIGIDVCSVDYRIEMPRALAARIRADKGDIRVRALAGSLRITTDVGDITATDLRGGDVSLSSDTGDIRIGYRADRVPDSITATTDVGDIRITVPATVGYAINSRTDLDDRRPDVTGLRIDSSSPHRISVATGQGDIRLTAA